MNLGGHYASFPGVVGTVVTKFKDTICARTGPNKGAIITLGLHHSIGPIEGHTLPSYYPRSSKICVKMRLIVPIAL